MGMMKFQLLPYIIPCYHNMIKSKVTFHCTGIVLLLNSIFYIVLMFCTKILWGTIENTRAKLSLTCNALLLQGVSAAGHWFRWLNVMSPWDATSEAAASYRQRAGPGHPFCGHCTASNGDGCGRDHVTCSSIYEELIFRKFNLRPRILLPSTCPWLLVEMH